VLEQVASGLERLSFGIASGRLARDSAFGFNTSKPRSCTWKMSRTSTKISIAAVWKTIYCRPLWQSVVGLCESKLFIQESFVVGELVGLGSAAYGSNLEGCFRLHRTCDGDRPTGNDVIYQHALRDMSTKPCDIAHVIYADRRGINCSCKDRVNCSMYVNEVDQASDRRPVRKSAINGLLHTYIGSLRQLDNKGPL
jgi:hypothetical protein